jgi:endonuclease YncB( thermonuclease family)
MTAGQKEEGRVSAPAPAAELPPKFTIFDPRVGPDGSIAEGENGRPFMLTEIMPFSSKDVCIRADGERWACGLHAYATLRNSVVHKSLQCTNEGSPDDPRISCQIDGRNLALILISNGLAELKEGIQEADLLRAQGKAKAAKIGVWNREAQSTGR